MPLPSDAQPYIGSRHFDRTEEDRRRFFGRDREIDELLALVLSHNAVLVYAASGAGKSSLVNAGVIPALVDEGFDVLPRGRVGVALPPGTRIADDTNPYLLNLLCSLSPDADLAALEHLALADFLRRRPPAAGTEGRMLVIDQAEELFTFTPKDWQRHQKQLFLELRDALRDAPDLRLILVAREDYLARFDRLAPLVPGGLRMRLHVEPLGRDAAQKAVEGPLAATGRRFDGGVAAQLVADLSRTTVGAGTGDVQEQPGPYVEPVQLQIVCAALWNKLPDGVAVITAEHLQQFGSVEETLERFYTDTVEDCVQRTGCDKEQLVRWFGEELITPLDTRGQVFSGQQETKGLPNDVIRFLDQRHLLHADERASGRWYELAHDRLIRPIRVVNERWLQGFAAARARRLLRRRIVRWTGAALVAIGLLVGFAAAVVVMARSRERALTATRIDELRGECGKAAADDTAACRDARVRVFDAVADYYWRLGETRELAALLKQEADLIPVDYGMPPITAVAGSGDGDHGDLLRIEFNPARPVDKWRMRSEWARIAERLAATSGIPVVKRIALAPDLRLPMAWVRVVARSPSCTEPATETVLSSLVQMPAVDGQALIRRAVIGSGTKLARFFDENRAEDGWSEHKALTFDGPWWSVPAWSLPVWRVGGHSAVSREAVLAGVVANELLNNPDAIVSCDAVKTALHHVAKQARATVQEALAVRGLEGLRLDLIALMERRHGVMYLPTLLDVLADHPDELTASAMSSVLHEESHDGTTPGPLQGPRKMPAAPSPARNVAPHTRRRGAHGIASAEVASFDAMAYEVAAPYREAAEQFPRGDVQIRVVLGPRLRAAVVDGNDTLHEDVVQRLDQVRAALYLQYGISAPLAQFFNSDREGLQIEILQQSSAGASATPIDVEPGQATEQLIRELDTRYHQFRTWWVTPEGISGSLHDLSPRQGAWLRAHYSVTDLKRLARALLAEDDPASSLRDLPWLWRSLAFWSHAYAADDLSQLARALRDTQRARLQPLDAAYSSDRGVADAVSRGLVALEADRLDDAEAQFTAALRVDRDAAITAFLARFPALSSLAPQRWRARLSTACHLPGADGSGDAIPGVEIEYEVLDLLASPTAGLADLDRRHLETCMVWFVASQANRPRELQTRLSALLVDLHPEAWPVEDAYFVARQWLVAHRNDVNPSPAEVSATRRLLLRALLAMPPAGALQAWRTTLPAALGDRPWRWTRELIADVAVDLSSGWPSLKLEIAQWLAGFGRADAERAAALVDTISPASNATDRWALAWTRVWILEGLAQYAAPAQRSQHIEEVAVAAQQLLASAPDEQSTDDFRANLAAFYVNMGDDARANEVIRASTRTHASVFDRQLFWIALASGDAHAAAEIAASLGRRDTEDLEGQFVVATLALVTHDKGYEEAARNFIFHDIKQPHPYVDYLRMILWWTLSTDGHKADAQQLLDERMADIHPETWAERLQQRDARVWREMLVAMFAGRIPASSVFEPLRDEAAFRASGLDQTELPLTGLRCEAYFYAALREQVTGDPATRDKRFRDALARVLETGEQGYYESRMARFFLASPRGT